MLWQYEYKNSCCFSSNLTCTQWDAVYVDDTWSSLSIRVNGHRFILQQFRQFTLPVLNHTKSHQPHFNSHRNVHVLLTYHPILITSIAAILNSPINSLCPLDTALVLTSDNFNFISPPSVPIRLSSCPFSGVSYSRMSHGAICTVYPRTFILFDRECRNVSFSFPYVCVPLIRRSLLFFYKSFPFLILFLYKA